MFQLPFLRLSSRRDPAVVRVRIKPVSDDGFGVQIEPVWVPARFRREAPPQEGCLKREQVKLLDTTYQALVHCKLGQSELTELEKASKLLTAHAQALGEVLWGESAWGQSHEAVSRWWDKLYDAVEFLVIELILDPDVQKYIWEAVLKERAWLRKAAVIRRCVNGEESHPLPGRPVRVALLSNQIGNLSRLQHEVQNLLKQLQAEGWVQVRPAGGTSEMDQLKEELENRCGPRGARPLTLVLVSHGNEKGEVQLDNGKGEEDFVDAQTFGSQLPSRDDVVLVLLACSVGGGATINPWLPFARVVVAMQLELSEEGASRCAQALLKPSEHPFAERSPLAVARQVKGARLLLNAGSASRIEAATPVIYSHVSVMEEIQRRRRGAWLRILALVVPILVAAAVVLPRTVTWPPPVTPTVSPATAMPAAAPIAGQALVKIAGKEYVVRGLQPIQVKATPGQTLRIEVSAVDAQGQPVAAGLANYQWTFTPPDPQNAPSVGTLSSVINYVVPSDRRGQNITVVATARDFSPTIVIQLAID